MAWSRKEACTSDTIDQAPLTIEKASAASESVNDVAKSPKTGEYMLTPFTFSFGSQQTACESDYSECPFSDSASVEQNGARNDVATFAHNNKTGELRPELSVESLDNEEAEDEADWVDEPSKREDFDKVHSSLEAALIEAEKRTSTTSASALSSRSVANTHISVKHLPALRRAAPAPASQVQSATSGPSTG